jgi:hypothetical protein
MMTSSKIIVCLALAAGAITGCAVLPTPQETYMLTVRLQDPCNRDTTITTPVRVSEPFTVTNRNDKVQNVVSGVLKPPVGGRFPMELTVSEWESEKSNMRDTAQLTLELGKPWSGGPVSSFVYLRTVTLTETAP